MKGAVCTAGVVMVQAMRPDGARHLGHKDCACGIFFISMNSFQPNAVHRLQWKQVATDSLHRSGDRAQGPALDLALCQLFHDGIDVCADGHKLQK